MAQPTSVAQAHGAKQAIGRGIGQPRDGDEEQAAGEDRRHLQGCCCAARGIDRPADARPAPRGEGRGQQTELVIDGERTAQQPNADHQLHDGEAVDQSRKGRSLDQPHAGQSGEHDDCRQLTGICRGQSVHEASHLTLTGPRLIDAITRRQFGGLWLTGESYLEFP
jgi:hypothetical protein